MLVFLSTNDGKLEDRFDSLVSSFRHISISIYFLLYLLSLRLGLHNGSHNASLCIFNQLDSGVNILCLQPIPPRIGGTAELHWKNRIALEKQYNPQQIKMMG